MQPRFDEDSRPHFVSLPQERQLLVVPGPESDIIDLAAQHDAARRARGWSYWKLAQMARVKIDTVHRMLSSGPHAGFEPMRIRFDNLMNVLDALGLDIEFVARARPETAELAPSHCRCRAHSFLSDQ